MLDPARTEIRYNSEWCDPLGARGMIQLAAKYTVARMMERDDFTKRFRSGVPISVHEFLYPLMQGYDSVALKSDAGWAAPTRSSTCWWAASCRRNTAEPQCILTMPLLVGTDGVEKMSKSKGNYVGVTEAPGEMFGKLMSISDDLMWQYYTLLSFRPLAEIELMKQEIALGRNPRDCKVMLAQEIVARFHSAADAEGARGLQPPRARRRADEIPAVSTGGAPLGIAQLLKQANLVPSTSRPTAISSRAASRSTAPRSATRG